MRLTRMTDGRRYSDLEHAFYRRIGFVADYLPNTSYALLGLLSFDEAMTAYELKQRADRTLAFFYWSPAMSAVYTELERLAKLGYVRAEDEAPEAGRVRRVHRITPDGKRELERWLNGAGWEPNQLKHFMSLKTMFAHAADPAVLAAQADEHAAWARSQVEELRQIRVSAETRARENDARWEYSLYVIEWGLDLYETEARSAERLAQRFRAKSDEASG